MRVKIITVLLVTAVVGVGLAAGSHLASLRRERMNRELQAALDRVDVDAVRTLLLRGADPNGEETPGYTALMHAIEHGDRDIVKALLFKGADVRRKDKNGMTALMYAGEKSRPDLIRLLQEAGATE